jgi:serralysin
MATSTTHIVRSAPGQVSVDLSGMGDESKAITVLADGKILVAGYSEYISYSYPGSPLGYYSTLENYSMIRLNADGTLDTSFGQGGAVIIDGEVDDDRAYYLAAQPDGKVIATSDAGVVQRFNADGSLDTSFGGGTGKVAVNSGSYDGAPAVTIGDDGSLYLTRIRGAELDTLAITKLNVDGSIATNYGDEGTFTFANANGFEGGYAISAMQADGSVLFGGDWSFSDNFAYRLVKLTATGQLDNSFGNNGTLVVDQVVDLYQYTNFTFQPDGKIILVGLDNRYDGVILRLNADGSLDTSFGENGQVPFVAVEGTNATSVPSAITVLEDGKILVSGAASFEGGNFGIARYNADGSVDTSFGSPDDQHHLDGYAGNDQLLGNGAAEIIRGLAGDDVLEGSGGRDVLYGGSGADIFRFTDLQDSYRTATVNGSDRIQDFDAGEDRIDLIGLGFTGLGNGLNGTLAVQVNAEGTRTYLKSYETNADGERFELAIDGNWLGQLDSSNVIFAPVTLRGTEGADVIQGTALAEVLQGLGGNDKINGGAGDDVIQSGAGRDILDGGADADTYLYTSVTDSYRTATESFSDVIVDFDRREDTIDVSALGYTGYGDGTNHTLSVSYNSTLDRTYLKDFTADSEGHRFELTLTGSWDTISLRKTVIFADAASESADLQLLGAAQAQDHATA